MKFKKLICAFALQCCALPFGLPGQALASMPGIVVQGSVASTLEPTPEQLRLNSLRTSVKDLPQAKKEHWASWNPGQAPNPLYADLYGLAVDAYQGDDLLLCVARALQLLIEEPDYPPALLLLGVANYRLQRYGEGVACYERFLKHAPNELARTRQLGHCYHSVGRSQEAQAHYTRLLVLQPGDFVALRSLAVVRLQTGDAQGAVTDLERVLKAQPEDREALYWFAAALYELEDSERSLAAARTARDANAYSSRVWYLYAQVLFDAGEQAAGQAAQRRHQELQSAEAAIRGWQQELYLHPKQVAAAEKIARLYLTSGNLVQAQRAYRKLAQLAQEQGDAETLARARRSLQTLQKLR